MNWIPAARWSVTIKVVRTVVVSPQDPAAFVEAVELALGRSYRSRPADPTSSRAGSRG